MKATPPLPAPQPAPDGRADAVAPGGSGRHGGAASRLAAEWCRDPGLAGRVADLFAAHAEPSYISHGELQGGRAAGPGRWAPDIRDRVLGEAGRAIAAAAADPGTGRRLAVLRFGPAVVGFAFVSLEADAPVPFAVLDDLLVEPGHRGRGAGRFLLDWVAEACRALGCRRLFLESGRDNHAAHRFFEARGFARTSVVMMRDLDGDGKGGPA